MSHRIDQIKLMISFCSIYLNVSLKFLKTFFGLYWGRWGNFLNLTKDNDTWGKIFQHKRRACCNIYLYQWIISISQSKVMIILLFLFISWRKCWILSIIHPWCHTTMGWLWKLSYTWVATMVGPWKLSYTWVIYIYHKKVLIFIQ